MAHINAGASVAPAHERASRASPIWKDRRLGIALAIGIAALAGVLALLWFLSPLITGLWIGRQLAMALGRETNDLAALIGGVLLLALLGRIPFVGWLVSLVSFVLALGALIVARRAGKDGRPMAQVLGQPMLSPAL